MKKGKIVRQGEGILLHGGNTCNSKGNETYEGSWHQDVMHGYGVYTYSSGAVYSGDWHLG